MSFFSTLASLWGFATDTSDAAKQARVAYLDGKPLGEVVRSFVTATDNDLDDAALDQLVTLLDRAVVLARGAADVAADLSEVVATHGPAVLETASRHKDTIEHEARDLAVQLRFFATWLDDLLGDR